MSLANKLLVSSLCLITGATLSITRVHAAGNAATGKNKVAACAGCHGADGNGGADATWPRLAGQDADYIAKQLADFKSGKRQNAIMQGMAGGLSAKDMQDVGAYYASLKASTGAARNKELAAIGEKIYRGGNVKSGIAACMSCHGPAGNGVPPRFPRVGGQSAAYTEQQMLAFKRGSRSNDGEVMTRIAFKMSEKEIKAVSDYLAGLH